VEGLAVKRVFGILGWLGVVLVLAALAFKLRNPTLNIHPKLALAGLIITLIYALSQWRDIGRSFSDRSVKYGSFALGSVLAFVAILVAINWIANRQNKRWDLTSAGQFSMSEQTRKIVSELKSPVTVRVFYGGMEGSSRYRDLLGEYQYLSKQISTEFIEADNDPVAAQKYEITAVPTVLVETNGRTERTNQADEQGITNTLKKALEGKAKKVYFTRGHGEKDTAGQDGRGYSAIAQALQTDNFEVAQLALAQESKVPDDASVVVIAGPRSDFLPQEITAIRAYLGRGGKLMLMLDPPEPGTLGTSLTSLVELAHSWGADVGNTIVIDEQSANNLVVPVVMNYPRHAVTDRFNGVMTMYPLTRSVVPVEGGADGKVAQKILETSPRSWAEADLKQLFETKKPQINLDKGDKAGPVVIATATSAPATDVPAPAAGSPPAPDAPKPETRVIVIGDSDFPSNSVIGFQGNKDLYLNMVNWLAQQENLISIRAKDPADRRLDMLPEQEIGVRYLALLAIPLLLFANGVRVWWKRR
jgi:gliding motility-associatede transport system auxiliary component